MNKGESKMKTSELCKQIFYIIKNIDKIKDDQLMKILEKQHGQQKMQNIKRRKYDIINILQNSGIILCHKNHKGQIIYQMGNYNVPNYQQKIHNLSSALNQKKISITQKINIIQRLKRTINNYQKIMKKNKQSQNNTQKINCPLHMIEGDIIHFQRQGFLGQFKLKAMFDKGAVMKNPLSDCQLYNKSMKVQI